MKATPLCCAERLEPELNLHFVSTIMQRDTFAHAPPPPPFFFKALSQSFVLRNSFDIPLIILVFVDKLWVVMWNVIVKGHIVPLLAISMIHNGWLLWLLWHQQWQKHGRQIRLNNLTVSNHSMHSNLIKKIAFKCRHCRTSFLACDSCTD